MTSARRAARGASATHSVVDPTAELLAGPCIEVWATRDTTVTSFDGPWGRARNAWRAACEDWATANATEAWHLRNHARARLPWSRSWLLEHGHRQWVEWLEGRTDQRPEGVMPNEWNSNT